MPPPALTSKQFQYRDLLHHSPKQERAEQVFH